jgi:hypothetical protein
MRVLVVKVVGVFIPVIMPGIGSFTAHLRGRGFFKVARLTQRDVNYFTRITFHYSSSLISGSPAQLVNTLRMPESAAVERTISQLTSWTVAVTPIVATAVCAIVLTARTAAALSHRFVFVFILIFPFQVVNAVIGDFNIIFDNLNVGFKVISSLHKVIVLVNLLLKLLQTISGELAVRDYSDK